MDIIITQIDGRSWGCVTSDDKERAIEAAEAVLSTANVTVEAAYSEYCRDWDRINDETPMTGLARIWVEAGKAASRALTEGWARPGHTTCYIAAA